MHTVNRRDWVLALAVSAIPLLGFWAYGLFDLDEGFYAAVSAEMLRSGDWITPRYSGEAWFEKPVLTYWLVAPSVAAFGENVGPRLPSALAALALCGVIGLFVARRVSPAAGIGATLVLGTSLLPAAAGRMLLVDPFLILCLAGSLVALFESAVGKPSRRAASGALLGLAVLAKGPVALILYAAVFAWTYFAEAELRPTLRSVGPNLCALALCMAIVAGWYVPCYLVNGETFVREFLLEQNWGRFLGGDKAHALPSWASPWGHPLYYPLVLAVGFLPWTLVEAYRAWSRPPMAAESHSAQLARRFLGRWAWAPLVFFTFSAAKLPHYVLPAVPAIAALLAMRYARTYDWSRARRPHTAHVAAALFSAIALHAGFLYFYRASGQEEAHRLARWIRSQNANAIAYRLDSAGATQTAGPIRMDETSLPSLELYLGDRLRWADDPEELATAADGELVFTRAGRIGDVEHRLVLEHGLRMERVRTPTAQDRFAVWLIRSDEPLRKKR